MMRNKTSFWNHFLFSPFVFLGSILALVLVWAIMEPQALQRAFDEDGYSPFELATIPFFLAIVPLVWWKCPFTGSFGRRMILRLAVSCVALMAVVKELDLHAMMMHGIWPDLVTAEGKVHGLTREKPLIAAGELVASNAQKLPGLTKLKSASEGGSESVDASTKGTRLSIPAVGNVVLDFAAAGVKLPLVITENKVAVRKKVETGEQMFEVPGEGEICLAFVPAAKQMRVRISGKNVDVVEPLSGTAFKMPFLMHPNVPILAKCVVVLFFVLLFGVFGVTLLYFSRPLIKGVFALHPVAWTVGCLGASGIMVQICDRFPSWTRGLAEKSKEGSVDAFGAFLTALEEGGEMMLAIFALIAILQAHRIYSKPSPAL